MASWPHDISQPLLLDKKVLWGCFKGAAALLKTANAAQKLNDNLVIKDLNSWLAYIEGLHVKHIDVGLQRTRLV